ncbi:MAG: zinc-binding dehydrogenase [Clostridia bacterium]|nr:zinc-binding dehydrogenase [Clostridia bacterium]
MELPKIRHMGVIVEPHKAEMHSEPVGEMDADSVFIQMETNNICTTDYQHWDGLRNHQGFPMAGGHEWSGTVLAVGENVVGIEVGDRVAPAAKGCGRCVNCRMGRTSCCIGKSGRTLVNGYLGQRGFSNYLIMDWRSLLKMNKDLPAAECGFLEPVSTAVSGMKKLRVKPGENVVVIGAGTMGLVNAQVAHAFGARVIVCELTDKKLARARSMGFADVINSREEDPIARVFELTDGMGADAVIAAVGNSKAYEQGYKMLKHYEGRFLLFAAGYPKPEMHIDPNEVHYRRLEIIGTMNSDVADFKDAAFMISNGIVNCSYSLEGAYYPLRDIQEAYKKAATPDTYRVTVNLQEI